VTVRSLLYKLLLSFLLVILLPMGLAILWTSHTLSTILERRFVEKSTDQVEQVQLLLSEKQETATGLVSWIAEMPRVKAAVTTNDHDGLFQHLLPLVGSVELDFIEILDSEGRIFLRVHDPSRRGDRPRLTKETQGLLRGMRDLSNYGIEERDGNLYLTAVEIVEEETILGVVSAGYALNSDLLKKLEKVSGSGVILTIGDRRLSAQGIEPSERQIPGASARGRWIETTWHRDKPSPSLEVRFPLETSRGNEGLISLFFPSHEMTAAIGTLQKTLLSVALVGMGLAFLVAWISSRRLTRPLKELVRGTEEVASGNYSTAVRAESGDEIGALASSFNHMLEELRRSKAEVESYRQELERKVAERSEQLVETEKKRAAMAHMIAHDLKNPLIGIKKTLERLEQATPEVNGEQRKRILTDLLGAGDLVIGMVNEMLDLYRSDFGDLPLSPASFPIQEMIQASLRILGPDLEEKRIEVIIRSDPLHISIVGDKKRLTRLIINLLSNAIKFSPEQGSISISTGIVEDHGSGSQLLLRVEDEGLGIPEKDLPRIFDRFYSPDQEIVERGTGLGLPYCKLVAEAHGGKILAENRDRGGFAVSVIIPMNAWNAGAIYAA
jgi:signal transduction histidine kinase